jgi:hypothetical protein
MQINAKATSAMYSRYSLKIDIHVQAFPKIVIPVNYTTCLGEWGQESTTVTFKIEIIHLPDFVFT